MFLILSSPMFAARGGNVLLPSVLCMCVFELFTQAGGGKGSRTGWGWMPMDAGGTNLSWTGREGWRKGDTRGKLLILHSFYTKIKFLAVYYFIYTLLLLEVTDRPLSALNYS